MKIFATTDSLFSPLFPITGAQNSRRKFIYGAWIGAENFYYGLLKHGSFDEYCFFVGSNLDSRLFKKNILNLDIDPDKVRIINIRDLARSLRKIKYTVFFTVGIKLSQLAYLRSKYAREYFPICGIAFETISYPNVLRQAIFNNLVSDLQPFDSIICASSAVNTAIRNLNRLVSDSFQKKTGGVLNYNGRLDYLPLGINAADYGKIGKLEAREKLGLAQDKIIILYFGRFSLYDKADLYPLLVAFKKILPEKRNAMLLLAGTDVQEKYGSKLQKITQELDLADKVKFILHNCLKEKYMLYSASDIFISPSDSIQESFGITVLEAMASGLPVIATDWNGYKDLIVHNETGLRIPTFWADCNMEDAVSYPPFDFWQRDHLYLAQSVCVDVKKMIGYLSVLVKNKELRLRFGRNARRRVLEKYDWSVVMPAYENLWEGLSKLSSGHKVKRNQKALFTPKYLDCFRHYPTGILNKAAKPAITKDGLLFLKAKKLPFKVQEELGEIISIKIIFMILTFLLGRKNAAIAEIEKYVEETLKVAPSLVRYNIMWLLKKNLLEL